MGDHKNCCLQVVAISQILRAPVFSLYIYIVRNIISFSGLQLCVSYWLLEKENGPISAAIPFPSKCIMHRIILHGSMALENRSLVSGTMIGFRWTRNERSLRFGILFASQVQVKCEKLQTHEYVIACRFICTWRGGGGLQTCQRPRIWLSDIYVKDVITIIIRYELIESTPYSLSRCHAFRFIIRRVGTMVRGWAHGSAWTPGSTLLSFLA
jgi:hypothetical protein